MSRWMICLSVLAISACATPADNWSDIKLPVAEVPELIELPPFPQPIESDENVAIFTKEDVKDMVIYTLAAKANTEAGRELAAAVVDLQDGVESIVDAARVQENISNMKSQMLEDERKHNFFMTIVYWGAIAVLGIAL